MVLDLHRQIPHTSPASPGTCSEAQFLAHRSCLGYAVGTPLIPNLLSCLPGLTLHLLHHQGLVQQSPGSWSALVPVPRWAQSPGHCGTTPCPPLPARRHLGVPSPAAPTQCTDGRREAEEAVCFLPAGRAGGHRFSAAFSQIAAYSSSGSCKGDREETCLLPSAQGKPPSHDGGRLLQMDPVLRRPCQRQLGSSPLHRFLMGKPPACRMRQRDLGKNEYSSDVKCQGDPCQAACSWQCPACALCACER